MRRIERSWQLDYQRSEDKFRHRVVDAGFVPVMLAVRETFLELGMPVQGLSLEQGVIVAENSAPNPLTATEWLEVAKIERPRLTQIAGPMFILPDDPAGYIVTVKVAVRELKGKTFILLDYEIEAPRLRRMGVQPAKYAPPLAVQLASAKFWAGLEKRLRSAKAPLPRQRSKQEVDA